MRLCSIVKAPVLSLGAIAVVARSLPEQRSEINGRGCRGNMDSATLQRSTTVLMVSISTISKPSHSDLSFPKGHIEANAGLSKRDRDYRGAKCHMECDHDQSPTPRDYDDCETLHENLSSDPYKNIRVMPGTSPFLFHFRRIITPE
jgi:hypothetical protein